MELTRTSAIWIWIKGLRIPLYWATGGPILLAYSLAGRYGEVNDVFYFAMSAAALLIFELGVNIMAESSDFREGVTITQPQGLIPTGPYLLWKTGISAERMASLAAAVLAVAALIGIYVVVLTGLLLVLLAGIIGGLLTFAYALPPFLLGFRGIGEPVPFLAFGPVPLFALFLILSGHPSLLPISLSIPTAFWITAVRYAHHLPDRSVRRGNRFEHMHNIRVKNARLILSLLVLAGTASTLLMYSSVGDSVLIPFIISLALSLLCIYITPRGASAVAVSEKTVWYLLLQFAGTLAQAISLIL